MSDSTDPEFDLDLQFLPDWAKEPAEQNRYANYRGDTRRDTGRDSRGPSRQGPPRGRPGPRRPQEGGPRRDRPRQEGGRGPREGFSRDRGRDRDREFRGRPPQRDVAPLPEVSVAFTPDEPGVESLVTQIRKTGRAYPLVEIARMFLLKPERYIIHFTIRKDSQGAPKQPLYACAVDNTLWLSEDQAAQHILSKSFELFYQTERTPVDPPKGTYTFVAQCGMSGVILGPPNYHDYQKQLHALHTERFARMPFETFKARVKIVRDEEVVKKWVEEQSFKTSYICLNMPEALTLGSRAEVEEHFRTVHLPNVVQVVESFSAKGSETNRFPSSPLMRLVRRHTEEQRRFPLQLMTALSQQFGARGLQFFKVNKTITHVAVARPHYLDMEGTPVSDGVRRIVEFINAHPDCNRKVLIDALAPPPPIPVAPPAPTPAVGEAADATPAPNPAPRPDPTREQAAAIGDLHWLIHQGHVIEFATGKLETAKKPAARPPQKPRDPTPRKPREPKGEKPPSSATDAAPQASAPHPVQKEGAGAPAETSSVDEATKTSASQEPRPESKPVEADRSPVSVPPEAPDPSPAPSLSPAAEPTVETTPDETPPSTAEWVVEKRQDEAPSGKETGDEPAKEHPSS